MDTEKKEKIEAAKKSKKSEKVDNAKLATKEKEVPLKEQENKQESAKEEGLEKKTGNTSSIMNINGRKLKTSLAFPFFKTKHPDFSVGDKVRVNLRIREGDKQRIQVYEGLVIAIRGEGHSRSFTVRRVTHEVGVERIYPYYSASTESIEVVRRGSVRRSRLYYLRDKSGKKGRIREAFQHRPDKKEKSLDKSIKTDKSQLAEANGLEDKSDNIAIVVEKVAKSKAKAKTPSSVQNKSSKSARKSNQGAKGTKKIAKKAAKKVVKKLDSTVASKASALSTSSTVSARKKVAKVSAKTAKKVSKKLSKKTKKK